MKIPLFTVWTALVILSAPVHPAASATPEGETLAVFVQTGASAVDRVFQQKRLPEIQKIAAEMNVPVRVIEANEQAPETVAITPLVVFQNHRGRSVYQGRTTTMERVKNFIRTSRFVPQDQAPLVREQIPVWENGRARIWAPIKISKVTGTPPPGYDHNDFLKEAHHNIAKGFKRFRYRDRVELGRADRGFYMDFYPWRADDGTLFLSVALYSQFHCKEPVFEKKKPPLIGPWKNRKKLFEQAAALLEAEVVNRIDDPAGGDGFDPVAADVKTASWESIGLALPPAPKQAEAAGTLPEQVPRRWTLISPHRADRPMIQFRFPSPLDQYRGEATRASGRFILTEELRAEGAEAQVVVDTTSVTMGEGTLDEALGGSLLLYSRKYPGASFAVDTIEDDGHPIAWGRLTPVGVSGGFTLKGTRKPLSLPMEIEPIVGTDGTPRLAISGSFRIDLKAFEIEGADGPAPQRDTLVFDLYLLFEPAE